MKKVMFLIAYMGTVFCSFAQETSTDEAKPLVTKEDYLKKSNGQRTVAIVLVSAGGAMAVAGLNLVAKESLEESFGVDEGANNTALGAVLIIAGVGAMLGSISLFKSATKYKRTAMTISFNNEIAPQVQRSMVFNNAVPSLTLKISL